MRPFTQRRSLNVEFAMALGLFWMLFLYPLVGAAKAEQMPVGMPIKDVKNDKTIKFHENVRINNIKTRVPESIFISIGTPATKYDAQGTIRSQSIRMNLDERDVSLVGYEKYGIVDTDYRKAAVRAVITGWPHKDALPGIADYSNAIKNKNDSYQYGSHFKAGKLESYGPTYLYSDGASPMWGACNPRSHVGIVTCRIFSLDRDLFFFNISIAVFEDEDVGAELDKAHHVMMVLVDTVQSWKECTDTVIP